MHIHKILITGAGSGIGQDTAFELARRGHRVLATTHTEAQAQNLLEKAREKKLILESFKLDILDEEDVAKAAQFEPNILINNAGIGESGPWLEMPFERIQNIVDVNLLGTLHLTRACVPFMLRSKAGRVITVASVAGRVTLPYLGAYNMTKFALESAFDALRMELAPRGVQVSLIEPGLIYTGFNEDMAQTKYEWLSKDSFFKDDFERMKQHDAGITVRSSSTRSIVNAMVHAVESRFPKTRYTAPFEYRLILLFLDFIPTWLKDRILRHAVGI